jgi:hypothetical protein
MKVLEKRSMIKDVKPPGKTRRDRQNRKKMTKKARAGRVPETKMGNVR